MASDSTKNRVRLDKWLWSVRIFKTRTQASDACIRGKVKCNGRVAKAARPMTKGDTLEIRLGPSNLLVRILELPSQRLAHEKAIACYEQLGGPEGGSATKPQESAFHAPSRGNGQGRPTKRQRRDLEGFMGGD